MDPFKLQEFACCRFPKVSRTIADLDASKPIKTEHLAVAMQHRSQDRENSGELKK